MLKLFFLSLQMRNCFISLSITLIVWVFLLLFCLSRVFYFFSLPIEMTMWFFFFSLLLQWYTWIDFQMILFHWVDTALMSCKAGLSWTMLLAYFSLSLLGSWGIIILLFCHPKIMCSWGKAYKISPSSETVTNR